MILLVQTEASDQVRDFHGQTRASDQVRDFHGQTRASDQVRDFHGQTRASDQVRDFHGQTRVSDQVRDFHGQTRASDQVRDFHGQTGASDQVGEFSWSDGGVRPGMIFHGQTGASDQVTTQIHQNKMGEAEIQPEHNLLILHAVINIYGDAGNESLAGQIARDIEVFWNEPQGTVLLSDGWFSKRKYTVRFNISGKHIPELTPQLVFENTGPRNNYFRVEEYANGNISFVDGINCNTGYFKLENLLNNSTTAAHEFGHTIGLLHPQELDIRGQGIPGIMYPRGSLVDPQFQYYPEVAAGEKGGTVNPFARKVLQKDIDNLHFDKLRFNSSGLTVVGDFSSVWHEKHIPPGN